MNISWGDSGEVGQAQGSQSDEHDGNEQNPKKITASERLSELVKTKTLSHDLYDVAANVLQELDLAKKKNRFLKEDMSRYQSRIANFNRLKSAIEDRKEYFENISRLILCPRALKSIMENFANNYLQANHDLVISRVSAIDKKLLDATNMEKKLRFEKTSTFVRQLLHLSLQEQNDNSFLNIWTSMKHIPYRVQPEVAEIIGNNELSSASIQLLQAANEIEAIQIFNNQKCNIWQSRNEILSANDSEAMEALSWISADDALESIRREGFHLVKVEEVYARDSFEIGPSIVKAANKQYKLCRMILMSSRHPAIIKIRPKLEARWPGHQRSQRLHWYSSAYARLFNIVSCQDLVGPSFKPPFTVNNITSEEFRRYIQILETKWSSDIAFVAETLYLP